MHKKLPVDLTAVSLRTDRSPPLSSICREVGLAAVAAALNLRASELELDAAIAVERGAAALFLAGFGPQSIASPRARDGESRRERKARSRRS